MCDMTVIMTPQHAVRDADSPCRRFADVDNAYNSTPSYRLIYRPSWKPSCCIDDGLRVTAVLSNISTRHNVAMVYSIMMLVKFSDLSQSNRSNWVMWQVKDPCPRPGWNGCLTREKNSFHKKYKNLDNIAVYLIASLKSKWKNKQLKNMNNWIW